MAPNDTMPSDLGAMEAWNGEDASELARPESLAAYNVDVTSRDWTVETIVQQVKQGNIDLDPAFQRRNAWRDHRRSRLIESFVLGFPVPQIVLAENPHRRKSFIVIDGKQRLMTIAGFYLAEYREYWTDPELSGLKVVTELNDIAIDSFLADKQFADERRRLANADIRTTIISGFRDEAVLYDIFYRINTGAVPLSSQELRQVLNRGPFSKYLLEVTSRANPIWTALNIDSPDPRLRDVELLLRMLAWMRYAGTYAGNMKQFLDDATIDLNKTWQTSRESVQNDTDQLFAAVEAALSVHGENLGRKFNQSKYERSFNRAVFEIQVFFLTTKSVRAAALRRKATVTRSFERVSTRPEFTSAVEATTKSVENTRVRFNSYRLALQKTLNLKIRQLELPQG